MGLVLSAPMRGGDGVPAAFRCIHFLLGFVGVDRRSLFQSILGRALLLGDHDANVEF
jgi:hypothetical protein